MTSIDSDELATFLLHAQARDLLEYLELPDYFSVGELDDALARVRRWCQGQQGNAKHREHARWFIKHAPGIRRLLTEHLPEYRRHVLEQRRQIAQVFYDHFRTTLRDVLDDPNVARVAALYERRLGLGEPPRRVATVGVQVEVEPTLVPDLLLAEGS